MVANIQGFKTLFDMIEALTANKVRVQLYRRLWRRSHITNQSRLNMTSPYGRWRGRSVPGSKSSGRNTI